MDKRPGAHPRYTDSGMKVDLYIKALQRYRKTTLDLLQNYMQDI